MSRMIAGIVSIVALSATFGAIQLASGRDLVTTGTAHSTVSAIALDTVNRGAKSDRARIGAASGASQTIMVQPDGLSSTSVLIRVPIQSREEARNGSSSSSVSKQPTSRKVACEPVVSVLTEVAKLLQPGRCVT